MNGIGAWKWCRDEDGLYLYIVGEDGKDATIIQGEDLKQFTDELIARVCKCSYFPDYCTCGVTQ